MSLESVIQEAIESAAKKIVPVFVSQGTVSEVDKVTKTCTVERQELPPLYDVRLNAVSEPSENTLTVFPKQGSRVLVAVVENISTDTYVLTADDPESIEIKLGNSTFIVTADLIEINGGDNGGLTITPTLVSNLEKNNAILEAILNILTGAPINEPGNGNPSALQAALSTAVAGKEIGDFTEIENDKVTH